MGLVITDNISSLIAQHNLSRTSSMLSQSLERLSSGLKINRGADGPAALVISQEQQAQIVGLQTAIDNTSKAVSMVQTTEGALGTINDLLVKIRSLALDSANSGVNDPNALAANQAEVSNALATIDRIANNTQFGTKKVLDGSAGFTGATDNSAVGFVNALTTSPTGTFAVNVTTAAQRASVHAGTGQTGNLAQNETLTLNGVSIALTSGQTRAQVQSTINQYTGQTGVTADNFQTTLTGTTAYTKTVGAGGGPATTATKLSDLTANAAAYVATDKINIVGTDADGTAINTTVTLTNGATATLGDVVNGINAAFQHATASVDASGNIVLTAKANDPLANYQNFSLTLSDHAGNTGSSTWSAFNTYGGDVTRLRSTHYGSAATISVQSTVAASTTSSGFGQAQVTAAGVDVAGTIGGFAASGVGNVLTGTTGAGAAGISVSAADLANDAVASSKGALGNVTVSDHSLVFQIGANANQTVKVAVSKATTQALGLNVAGNQFASLGQIDVRSQSGAQDAIKIVDQAILDVSNQRGTLGAIQAQTLQSSADNMQTTLENTTAAQSVIRDTDFAKETANFTKAQVLMQVGTTVLSNSNQLSQLVLGLFK